MSQQPSLWQGFAAIVRRDLLLAYKRPGDVLNPLVFFAVVATLFPLAVGPARDQLQAIGPRDCLGRGAAGRVAVA